MRHRLGRHAEATPALSQSLEIRRRLLGDEHADTANSYEQLAQNLDHLDRSSEASLLLAEALSIRRKVLGEEHPETARSYTSLGMNFLNRGFPAEAAQFHDRALSIYRKVLGEQDPRTIQAYYTVAVNLIELGRPAEAIPLLEKVLSRWRATYGDQHPAVVDARALLAHAQLQVPGRETAAVENARAAVAAQRARRAVTTPRSDDAQQLRDARQATEVYRVLADLLWLTGKGEAAARDEAFAALQDSIVSSAGAAVVQMGARLSGGDDARSQLARQRQDLATRLAANDEEQVRAVAAGGVAGTQRLTALRKDASLIQQQLDRIDADLRNRFPTYFDLVNPGAISTATLQGLLEDGEALLLVAPGFRGTHVLAVTKSQSSWQRSNWTIREVDAAVSRLRCDLDSTRCSGVADPAGSRGAQREGSVPRHGSLARFARRTAFELYEQVVAPAMPTLHGARTVYVVTAGTLSALPFSVLVTEAPVVGEDDSDPETLRRTPWLLRRFALVSLPSVASLKAVRLFEQSAASGEPARLDFIGFGDPDLGGSSGTSSRALQAGDLFKAAGSDGAGRADPDALRRAFAPLPGTKVELEAMQAAFAPRSRIMLGAQATESQVKSTSFAGVKVVAFSTHGLIAGEIDGIAEPGLVFTPPMTATAEDDGLLGSSEVAQLRLNADWVILSACNTAASDGTPGADALSGLARAFFYAGARTLLVSHWPVRDDVAAVLTVDAIRRRREDISIGRAEAVRQATLAVLDSSADAALGKRAFAHPSAWAPFVLVGEGR
jgi:CHAT domain-containing protein/tetratricopeptide (TPR) repeat protein